MTIILRILVAIVFVAGMTVLSGFGVLNRRLANEVEQLEAELGRMSIKDRERVHLVAIERPAVPPEVALNLEGIWQFRCYLPPGYDFQRMSGGGRVSKDSLFFRGGSNTSWSPPNQEAQEQLLTISLQKSGTSLKVFTSTGNSTGTSTWEGSTWEGLEPGKLKQSDFVVEPLVNVHQAARSFDKSTILPLLKMYDTRTEEIQQIENRLMATYAGGLIVLCPKTRTSDLTLLQNGQTPDDYDPNSVAEVSKP